MHCCYFSHNSKPLFLVEAFFFHSDSRECTFEFVNFKQFFFFFITFIHEAAPLVNHYANDSYISPFTANGNRKCKQL